MKKIAALILVVIMSFVCSTAVFAEAIPYTTGSQNQKSILMISRSTATCTSTFVAEGDEVSSVEITQSLEKHSFLWMWETVGGEWNKTTNGSSSSFTNKVSGLSKGTYRVKSVFNVTTKSGKTETTTLYSDQKSVN